MAKTSGDGTSDDGESETFSDVERRAMKERAAELKAHKGGTGSKKQKELQAALDRIAEMPDAERVLAEAFHRIVTETAPELDPKTWYSMPAYAKDGKVVCFFQAAGKFDARYCTIGFSDVAALDDGGLWPTSYAVTTLRKGEEKRVVELVRRAVG